MFKAENFDDILTTYCLEKMWMRSESIDLHEVAEKIAERANRLAADTEDMGEE